MHFFYSKIVHFDHLLTVCVFLWSLLVRCFELWRFCAQFSTEQHRGFKSAHCRSKVGYIAGARVGLLRGTAALPSWDEVSIWTSKAWDEVSYNRLRLLHLRLLRECWSSSALHWFMLCVVIMCCNYSRLFMSLFRSAYLSKFHSSMIRCRAVHFAAGVY